LKKAHDAGCDAHIAKPVKKATLLAAVRKAVGDAGGQSDGLGA
jgi:CheY-like chemotaxis protein